jgi:hypothetical protein
MKGKIWVESELGKGSRFHFTAHFGLQIDSVRTVIPRDPMILRDMRVLIVDDNETNCHILVKMLCLARQTCSGRKRSKSDERSEGGVGTGAHLSVDSSRRANVGDGRLCFRGKHQAQPRMGDRCDHDAQLREPAWGCAALSRIRSRRVSDQTGTASRIAGRDFDCAGHQTKKADSSRADYPPFAAGRSWPLEYFAGGR